MGNSNLTSSKGTDALSELIDNHRKATTEGGVFIDLTDVCAIV